MKKIISLALVLALVLCMSCVYANETAYAPGVVVYNASGASQLIERSELDTYLENEWYLYPVVTIYRAGNVSSVVYVSDVTEHLNNGWYLYPVTNIYAPGGRESIVYTADVEYHLNNGWYLSRADFPIKEKAVAITFDDGPGIYTDRILECLKKYNAKATFFVVGKSVYAYPDVLKRTYEAGMEIGNHTQSHTRLTSVGASTILSEINTCSNAIKNVTGEYPSLVRPPYGSYKQSVIDTAGLPFILWSIDTLDWKTRNAQSTVNTVLKNVKDGDIILMHDIHLPTAVATEMLVPKLVDLGFDLVTVSELAERKGIELSQKSYSRIK